MEVQTDIKAGVYITLDAGFDKNKQTKKSSAGDTDRGKSPASPLPASPLPSPTSPNSYTIYIQ